MEEREAFEEKMKAMKDTRKQAILERLDERISNLNDRHTERLDAHVTRLTEILEKIKTKVETLKTDGEEVEAVETAIEEAEVAIEAARTLVDAQVEKEYVIEFTTESQIKAEATKVNTLFKTDIKALHESVKSAHKEVVDAAQALAKARNENVSPTRSSGSESMSDDESTSEGTMVP